MSGVALSRSPLCSGAEMLAILRVMFPRLLLVELSYPQLDFAWRGAEAVAVLDPERLTDPAAQRFYQRFRQRGGHLALLSPERLGVDLAVLRRQLGTERVAFVAHDRAAIGRLGHLDPDLAELCLLCGEDGLLPAEGDGSGAVSLSFAFQRDGVVETFHLLARRPLMEDAVTLAIAAAREFAVDIRLETPARDAAPPRLQIILPDSGAARDPVCITPGQMLHDGTRQSERAGDYGWLWIGRERHLRVLLGAVPPRFRCVRVVVPKAFSTENFCGIRLLVNGSVVPASHEIWSEGAGVVAADLPPERDGDLVLGVSVPAARLVEDGQTMLAAIIDKIELA